MFPNVSFTTLLCSLYAQAGSLPPVANRKHAPAKWWLISDEAAFHRVLISNHVLDRLDLLDLWGCQSN